MGLAFNVTEESPNGLKNLGEGVPLPNDDLTICITPVRSFFEHTERNNHVKAPTVSTLVGSGNCPYFLFTTLSVDEIHNPNPSVSPLYTDDRLILILDNWVIGSSDCFNHGLY